MVSNNHSKYTDLSSLFTPGEVVCEANGLSEAEILSRLVAQIAEAGQLDDMGRTLEILVGQRCCGFSYLEPEVAIFHARVPGVHGLCMALAPIRRTVQSCWTPEPLPVRLFVLILASHNDPTGYLRVITALENLLARPGVMERLASSQDPRAVWQVFADANERLPPYITAREIMRADIPRLRDTDTISVAVDSFCRLGVSELPVVDDAGDLVGVVSEDELIRICLPEYITWMEDLTPILNFQPFAEMLQREEQMPLIEIMQLADHCAVVEESTPAIQVAKTMMRRDVRQVVVVRGRQLVGGISIQDFIRKVLRA